jgi:hypothetical protein
MKYVFLALLTLTLSHPAFAEQCEVRPIKKSIGKYTVYCLMDDGEWAEIADVEGGVSKAKAEKYKKAYESSCPDSVLNGDEGDAEEADSY